MLADNRARLAENVVREDKRQMMLADDDFGVYANVAGLPEDFDLDSTASLGLQIVRTLVVAELGGRLDIAPQADGGTRVLVEVPVQLPTGGSPDGRPGQPA